MLIIYAIHECFKDATLLEKPTINRVVCINKNTFERSDFRKKSQITKFLEIYENDGVEAIWNLF